MYYEIHGISDCPSCLMAQATLMEHDKQYVFINADFSIEYRNSIREQLFWKTFPIVVMVSEHKRELIGGYDQLIEHMKR